MMINLASEKMSCSCNIPFAVVVSESFKKLIHILRPSFKPPLRKELAGSLLEAVYNEMDGLVCEKLKGNEGTLVIDGLSNIHHKSIITSCIQVKGES
ncbi:hypothetical protein TNCT_428261 [Trichonephila clavata]|uniref:Uncharacterized protein n=1 Tax=Trichonephila clavata TaxID=2740835 RepID=A0A8X6FCX0_TRICU|nr:hypothetical protein TNCT_428261 [Trichonephila clavata]